MLRLLLGCCLVLGWVGLAQAASPVVQSWVSSQGARVLYVHTDSLPMLDIRVVFNAGSARDGVSPGLASFTNALLIEGAGDWDAQALAARVEGQGIRLSYAAHRDMAWVAARTLTHQPALSIAVESMAQILGAPRFAAESIQQIQQQLLVSLRQRAQVPSQVAADQLYQTLYGKHPYAHPVMGTIESVQAMTRQAIQAFHQRYYVVANAVVALVGDVDRATAEQLVEQVLSGMAPGQEAPVLPTPNPVSGQQISVPFPASQSHLMIGRLGMSRHDPDYFPLYVGNHILGGGALTSILGEAVRNQRGLSYSVYSYFRPMQVAGPFTLVAQTQNAQAQAALQVMQAVSDQFFTTGPTVAQLRAAQQHLIGGFPLQVASNRQIVEYIAMIGFYRLPLDWLETLPDKIAAVSVEQIRSAWQRRIRPQSPVTVIVGGGENRALTAHD